MYVGLQKMPEYNIITYQCSVERALQYNSNDDDDGDHNESYESPENYSPFRPQSYN